MAACTGVVLILVMAGALRQAAAATIVDTAQQPDGVDGILNFGSTASGLSPTEVLSAGTLGRDQVTADETLTRQLEAQGAMFVRNGGSQTEKQSQALLEPAPRRIPKAAMFVLAALAAMLVVSGAALLIRWLNSAASEVRQPPPMVFDLPRS